MAGMSSEFSCYSPERKSSFQAGEARRRIGGIFFGQGVRRMIGGETIYNFQVGAQGRAVSLRPHGGTNLEAAGADGGRIGFREEKMMGRDLAGYLHPPRFRRPDDFDFIATADVA